MQENETLALILSLLAGLSTCIGSIAIFGSKQFSTRTLAFCLGFSSGVMIYVAIGDLMPEAGIFIQQSMTGKLGELFVLLYLSLGILLAIGIEAVVPSEAKIRFSKQVSSVQMLRVGMVSALAVILHNFPEGMATFMAGYQGISVGLPIALAVTLHNIPEGLVIAMPIYFATKSRKKAFIYSFFAGLAEPFGAVITYIFLKPFLTTYLLGAVFAIVAGIMLVISFHELLPTSQQHGHKYASLCGVFLGIIFMAFCVIVV